jgi:hypothetical protein
VYFWDAQEGDVGREGRVKVDETEGRGVEVGGEGKDGKLAGRGEISGGLDERLDICPRREDACARSG